MLPGGHAKRPGRHLSDLFAGGMLTSRFAHDACDSAGGRPTERAARLRLLRSA